MRPALALLIAVACGCAGGDARQVRLELITRSSCRLINYDISCVDSLWVGYRGEDQDYRSRCLELRPEGLTTLSELINASAKLIVLDEVRARGRVRVELRGYHALDDTRACTSLSADKLLLWGSSALVDLRDEELEVLNVEIECRPLCDCRLIADGSCALPLAAGVCGPPATVSCAGRSCTDALDCFDGELECLDQVCEPLQGGLCADCAGAAACQTGPCVQHSYQDSRTTVDETYCAEVCPPAGDATWPCPSGMSCKRLGDGVFSLVP